MQIELFSTTEQKLPALPSCVSYWPNVLSQSQAEQAYSFLVEQINWQQPHVTVFGKRHLIPRLQCWMADDDVHYSYSDQQMLAMPWLAEVVALKTLVEQCTRQTFNSVLINYYRDGDDKMGWHADDEPELGSNPVVATLSLGAIRDFQIRHNQTHATENIALANGSVLLMKAGMQRSYKHQLPARKRVSSGRISLTFRYVTAPL